MSSALIPASDLPGAVLGIWLKGMDPVTLAVPAETRAVWFKKDPILDSALRTQFGPTLEYLQAQGSIASTPYKALLNEPKALLSLAILMDQFSRNVFRDSPKAFALDSKALAISKLAFDKGFDLELKGSMPAWLYMPLMHSETKQDHELAVKKFTALAERDPTCASYLAYEMKHKIIIDQFGRYPHRNEILGRESTPAETQWLKDGGDRF